MTSSDTTQPGASFSFIHIADIHVGTPRSFRFKPAWNANWETARREIINLKPDFLLVGGDTTRDGSTHVFELKQIKANFDAMPFPVHVIPGNHEVGNKFLKGAEMSIQPAFLDLYSSVFGSSSWSFDHKGTRFSGCDAFLFGSGLPEEQVLRDWLRAQSERPRCDRHVWVIHPCLFADEFDDRDWDPVVDRRAWYFALDDEPRRFLWGVFKATGATAVITAHIHCRRHVRFDGIDVHFAPSTAFPQWERHWPDGDASLGFLRFEVNESGMRYSFVPLVAESSAKGYGPGGNPGMGDRDYGLAQEQPALVPPMR